MLKKRQVVVVFSFVFVCDGVVLSASVESLDGLSGRSIKEHARQSGMKEAALE